MSKIGLVFCVYLLIVIAFYRKINPKSVMKTLFVIVVLQIIFSFSDVFEFFRFDIINFLFFCISLIIVAILLKKWLNKNVSNLKILFLFIIVVLGMIYTEFYNGFYSFKNISEFESFHKPLKEYYTVFPIKTKKTYIYSKDANVTVYCTNMFESFDIKRENGKLYYYRQGAITETGRWFELGIPEGKQVL